MGLVLSNNFFMARFAPSKKKRRLIGRLEKVLTLHPKILTLSPFILTFHPKILTLFI